MVKKIFICFILCGLIFFRVNSFGEEIYENNRIEKETPIFTDISGRQCEDAVKKLNELKIISGYPDNTFRPDNFVTRAEISTILTKISGLEIKENESYFSDISGSWAKPYIDTIYKNGYVSGYPDGTFKPENKVTYAETITMLLNVIGYKDSISNINQKWPDNYIESAINLDLISSKSTIDYNSYATRGNIAILTLQAYLLK